MRCKSNGGTSKVEFGACDWCGVIPGIEKWAVFFLLLGEE